MQQKHFYVYILASRLGGTLYVGVTNDLMRRVWEHRESSVEGFIRKHDVHRLVYFEQFDDIVNAIKREKRLKKWNRDWKIRLIEEKNLNWGRSVWKSGLNLNGAEYWAIRLRGW